MDENTINYLLYEILKNESLIELLTYEQKLNLYEMLYAKGINNIDEDYLSNCLIAIGFEETIKPDEDDEDDDSDNYDAFDEIDYTAYL